MMPRSMLLICLLLLMAFTSQFEWKQQIVNEVEASSTISRRLRHASEKEESVKEKIILLQEKRIQKLNELLQNLQDQLLQCRGRSGAVNDQPL